MSTSEKYGVQNEKDTEIQRKAAERPVDQDPLYMQLSNMHKESERENTRLAARNLDLEHTNKVLEAANGRFAVIAMEGGIKIRTATQVVGSLSSLSYMELQDVALAVEQEMKKRPHKEKITRERNGKVRANGNGNGSKHL